MSFGMTTAEATALPDKYERVQCDDVDVFGKAIPEFNFLPKFGQQ